MKSTIPVLLLTGYLGSGKTTLVNKILSNRKGIKFAVIVNDIGEVNIDEALIAKDGIVSKQDDSLVALQNGCICCTLKMDLVEQLKGIADSGKFDYIVIEASGICEPEPIAQTICSIKDMVAQDGSFYITTLPKLDCIVTVVDALRMRDEFACAKDLLRGNIGEDDIENLVIEQVEFCNIILLNKASEISKEDLGRVHAIIRTLQPKAKIIECDWGEVDLDLLLNTGLFDYDSVATSATWISEVEHGADHDEDGHAHGHDDHDGEDDHDGHEHHDGHHHEHHHGEGETEEYGIGTYVYFARQPFDLNKFDNFVAKHWPTGIIRAKGLCYFEEQYDKCYLFEQAGCQISLKDCGAWYATMPEDELQNALANDPTLVRDWDETYGDRMQKLVFIGQNLDKDAIKKALDFCLM